MLESASLGAAIFKLQPIATTAFKNHCVLEARSQ